MKKLDKSIALLEDYLEWQKLHDMDGTGIDEATKNLIEVAKKYHKIEKIIKTAGIFAFDVPVVRRIKEVIKDENKGR